MRKVTQQLKELSYYVAGSVTMLTRSSTDFIFILAMARSGSTLLAHILSTNPSIIGMGETKTEIKSTRALRRIIGRVLFLNWRYGEAKGDKYRYVLDKIVLNRLLDPANVNLLKDDRFRIIFLVREPQATIRSILRVFPHFSEKQARDFYLQRSKTIREYMQILSTDKTSLGLTYSQLINCTQPTLHMMENYLDLSIPLRERYETSGITGDFLLGDKSTNIQTGEIIRNQDIQKGHVPNSTDILTVAEEEYALCLAEMKRTCICLDTDECH